MKEKRCGIHKQRYNWKNIHSKDIAVDTQELYFYLTQNFFHTLLPILSTY